MASRARTLTLNTKVNVTGADQLKGLGRTLQTVGRNLTIGVTTPLALLAGVATHAASDLNESMNAINVVFGETADQIHAIGETSAESFGLSQRAFNQAATQFSAFAKTVAGEGGNVSRVVEDITQRASDFASVHNIEVAEALQLFQSGLAGETEPLRKFGVDLSAAAVQAHALATGISDGVGPLTEAEKVQARYSLLLERTALVQGDFANTSMEAANAQRIAAARAEDAAAVLGQKFLPIKLKVIEALTSAIDAWSKLPAPMQDAIVVFGIAAAALGPLLALVGSLVRGAGLLVKVFPAATAALRLLGVAAHGAFGPIGLLVGALSAAFATDFLGFRTKLLADIEEMGRGLNNFAMDFGDMGDTVHRLADEAGVDFQEMKDRITDAMEETGHSFEQTVAVIERGARIYTDAQVKMLNETEGAWTSMHSMYDQAVNGPGGMADIIETGVGDMATEMGEAPGKMADELLAAQFRLTDATTQLVEFMDQALSPAQERFQIQGFLASAELANALTDNNALVRQKAEEMQQAAIDRLAEIRSSFFTSGSGAGYSFGSGLVHPAVLNHVAGNARLLAAVARGVFPDSEPKDPLSPLRGITKGFGFGEILAKGLSHGRGAVAGAFRGLVGDGLNMPSVGSLSPAMAGGGTVVNNIYLQWSGEPPQGRTEAEIAGNLKRLSAVWG